MAAVQQQPVPPQQQQPVVPQQPIEMDPAAVGMGPQASVDPSMTMTSLYVGDLHSEVNEAMLFDRFSPSGVITSIRVCRDHVTRRSLRYAYVNFQNHEDAKRALEDLNFEPLKDKPMRISWSNRDPSSRRTGEGNIFIKNLDRTIDSKQLLDTFQMFGDIMSCKVATDENGDSKGYGFVHFVNTEDADKALEAVNGKKIGDQQVSVARFLPKKERQDASGSRAQLFTNVYVKNLPESMSDDALKAMCNKHGSVTSLVIMRDEEGKSKRFGFVNFENAEDAAEAVKEMDGLELDGTTVYACRAQKRNERRQMLENQHMMMRKEREAKTQGVNLYIKNLDENIDDDALRNAFSKFGTITSVKVMRDNKGTSKGFGFVCFSAPEEATKAMTEMSSKIIAQKPLYIAPAQRKAEREQLMMQRHQFGRQMMPFQPPMGYMPQMAPMAYRGGFAGQMQRGGPRGGWQQPPQGMMPAMMRPGQQMPMGVPPQQAGVVPPQQMVGGGRGGRSVRGGRGGMQQNGGRPLPAMMNNMSLNGGAAVAGGVPAPSNSDINASDLAAAPEHKQKQMLGEKLFPLIKQNYGQLAGKITGMLLAMDNSELLHLLEDKQALDEKAAEAQRVLDEHRKKQGGKN